MTGDVIKSFLVGLGFGVDEASLSKFNKAINQATLKVTALYASTKLAAAGIAYGISKISESFEQLGYEYKIIAPAINKALILRKEMFKAYAATGINLTKVVQASVKLNLSIAKTKIALEAIYKSTGSRFFALLTKQSDIFRKSLYENMPKIINALERFVKFVFKALEATTALGTRVWSILTRVYDFFVMLDQATDGWSTKILAVIAAWKLLNLSFLATPIGATIAGLVALLALYDDLQTFKEGGQSLFDWGPVVPWLNTVKGTLSSIIDLVFDLILAFKQLFHLDFSNFKEVFQDLKNIAGGIWDVLKPLGGFIADITGGGGNVANLQNPSLLNRNLGTSGGANSQTNQNVKQQTNINVMGSADAGAVGKAVAGEQSKVNFDMVRNMKGATR